MDRILDVDLIAFERGDRAARAAVVDGVTRSLSTGFVYSSHDIADGLLDEAYGMLAAFFALPAEAKARSSAAATDGQSGYTGVAVERAVGAGTADWKEMLNWSQPLPAGHPLREAFPRQYSDPVLPEADVPGITAVLGELHRRLLDLQARVLRIVAVGLGLAEGWFDDLLVDGATLDRAIRYPPMAPPGPGSPAGATGAPGPGGPGSPPAGAVWAAEHADINLLTALPRASAPGLQVATEDGWVDAVAPDGRVILNTGLMLERLTNGRVPAGVHRVVADPGQAGDRLSMVQFCHPAGWMILEPLPQFVDADHPRRYGSIRAGDLLARVLWDIGLIPGA